MRMRLSEATLRSDVFPVSLEWVRQKKETLGDWVNSGFFLTKQDPGQHFPDQRTTESYGVEDEWESGKDSTPFTTKPRGKRQKKRAWLWRSGMWRWKTLQKYEYTVYAENVADD